MTKSVKNMIALQRHSNARYRLRIALCRNHTWCLPNPGYLEAPIAMAYRTIHLRCASLHLQLVNRMPYQMMLVVINYDWEFQIGKVSNSMCIRKEKYLNGK